VRGSLGQEGKDGKEQQEKEEIGYGLEIESRGSKVWASESKAKNLRC